MCITRKQIEELDNIINTINTVENETEILQRLSGEAEDVQLLLSVLKKVNKNKLSCYERTGGTGRKDEDCKIYNQDDIKEIFANTDINVIVKKYSKKELTDMFNSLFKTAPLSSYGKNQIAEEIRIFLYQSSRTKELLG